MSFFLLLVLCVYCYRQHAHCYSQLRYAGSQRDGGLHGRLRDSANENEFEEIDDSSNGSYELLPIIHNVFQM